MLRAAAQVWTKLHGALHRRLIFFAGGRFSRFCRPVFIAFLLTERCNARCVHCDIWKNKGKEESPGIDEWKKVLKDLRRWLGPVGIVFTGGEVLLYPHALELVQYAVSLGFQLEVLTPKLLPFRRIHSRFFKVCTHHGRKTASVGITTLRLPQFYSDIMNLATLRQPYCVGPSPGK